MAKKATKKTEKVVEEVAEVTESKPAKSKKVKEWSFPKFGFTVKAPTIQEATEIARKRAGLN